MCVIWGPFQLAYMKFLLAFNTRSLQLSFIMKLFYHRFTLKLGNAAAMKSLTYENSNVSLTG